MHTKNPMFIMFQVFAFLSLLLALMRFFMFDIYNSLFIFEYSLFILSSLLLIIFGFLYDRIHKGLFAIPVGLVIIVHALSISIITQFNLTFFSFIFILAISGGLVFHIVTLFIDRKELSLVSTIILGGLILLIPISGIFFLRLFFPWNTMIFMIALVFLNIASMDKQDTSDTERKNDIYSENNIAINIILSIITFGIYFIIWLYRLEVKIRELNNDKRDLTGTVLCLIFVPFYKIYWFYNREQLFVRTLHKKGQTKEDNSLVYLLLSIFGFGLIAAALMQNDFNRLEDTDKLSFQAMPEEPDSEQKKDLALLKEIKSLYEEGVLTEEEYDTKKQQILDRL